MMLFQYYKYYIHPFVRASSNTHTPHTVHTLPVKVYHRVIRSHSDSFSHYHTPPRLVTSRTATNIKQCATPLHSNYVPTSYQYSTLTMTSTSKLDDTERSTDTYTSTSNSATQS